MSTNQDDSTRNERTHDFRYYAADAFSFAMNDNNIKIVLGLEEVPGKVIDQAGLVLSPKTLKLLSILTDRAVTALEKSGQEIVLDKEKIDAINQVFSLAGEKT